ncbi:hypothetical protein D3C71_1698120 [compost metagenome]
MAGRKLIPFGFPDISYGAYIYHFPVMAFVVYKLGYSSPIMGPLLTSAILIPTCLLSWYIVEKPALKLKPSKTSKPADVDPRIVLP